MEQVKAVIDRLEGDQAILLVGDAQDRILSVRALLPPGAKEGDWLKVEILYKRILSAVIDAEETANAKQRIDEKLAALRRGDLRGK
jgi:hypothetical protein